MAAFGELFVDQLSPEIVQDWVAKLSTRLAPSTVRRTYTILAQLVDAAVDTGILSAIPTARVRLPRVERYEARFLTPPELDRLAELIRPPWRAMVLTKAYATLRIGEAAGLRRCDLDHSRLRVANNLVVVGAASSKVRPRPPPGAAP